jgi:hypothetical protein
LKENIFSWYEIAAKLRLPEMISKNSKELSVLENMTSSLINEASVRLRQPAEVFTTGLANLPKATSFKAESLVSIESFPDLTATENTFEETFPKYSNISSNTEVISSPEKRDLHARKKKEVSTKERDKVTPHRSKAVLDPLNGDRLKSKTSSENWIPEINRMRSLHRHIAVAKETLNDIIMREISTERETRRFLKSDIDRAHEEESLNTKKKIQCACCYQMFSYVCLPLRVSTKAVIDMRRKWCGEKGITSGWWFAADEKLARIPRCYTEVLVCLFCSQFFSDQESYRPTFETIMYNKKKAEYIENQKREKEYWDPLKMVEKDRLLMESRTMDNKIGTHSLAIDDNSLSVSNL